MYRPASPAMPLPTWQHPARGGARHSLVAGVLIFSLLCAACTSVYHLAGARRELGILRAELAHGATRAESALVVAAWVQQGGLRCRNPCVTPAFAAGAARHEHAQEVTESSLQKLQEQVRWLALLPAAREPSWRGQAKHAVNVSPAALGAQRRHGAQGGRCSVQGPRRLGARSTVVQHCCGRACFTHMQALCQHLAPQHSTVGADASCGAPAWHNLAPAGVQAEAELKACREASEAREEQRAAELRAAVADADARAQQVRRTVAAVAPVILPWPLFRAAHVC